MDCRGLQECSEHNEMFSRKTKSNMPCPWERMNSGLKDLNMDDVDTAFNDDKDLFTYS